MACFGLFADANEKFRHACRDGHLIKAQKYYNQFQQQPEIVNLDVNSTDKVKKIGKLYEIMITLNKLAPTVWLLCPYPCM